MGVKISKSSSHSCDSLSIKLFLKIPYFEISNLIFFKKIEIFDNMGPYGSEKFQNATPPTVIVLFQPNFVWMFLVTVLTKVTYRNIDI